MFNRYAIYSAEGVRIAQAPTAQKAADMATHRTVTQDTWGGNFPFTVWGRIDNGLLGEAFRTHAQAFKHCAKIPRG